MCNNQNFLLNLFPEDPIDDKDNKMSFTDRMIYENICEGIFEVLKSPGRTNKK